MQSNKQNDAATDRRIRVVYDHLDSGNNKKALQEIDKLLKKNSDLVIAKALKALALVRLGNAKDSRQYVDEVIKDCPTSICILKFLRLCLYELNLNDKVCLAYENAFRKEPTNEDLFAQLYMAYAIDGEFKKQNLITMNLSKSFPHKNYRFWSVLSIYMQAINHADQRIALSTLYPLAKRMVEKFENEDQFKESSEVELYLLILEKTGDYNRAIEVIDGKLGKLLNNSIGFVDEQKANYLFNLKKYDQSFDIFVNLIEKNTDAIAYYLKLIEIIKLNDIPNEKNRFVIKLFDLFEQLKPECDFKVRGYYLARIEAVKQVEDLDDQSYAKKEIRSSLPAIDRLLVEYFEVFGCKQAFIYDFFYLNKKYEFSTELISGLINEISQQVQTSTEIKSEENLIRHSNYHALLQTTGHLSNVTKEDRVRNFEQLVNYYNDSLNLKNNFTKTEFNHGDFYLQIAVYYLNELNAEQDDDLILSLILVLEKALRKCTANYTLKVFLIYLYNLIGTTSCSYLTFEKLDIKYILFDSLSYLVFNELYLFGNYFTYSNLLNSSDKFFQTNSKETLDYLSLSYKHGNFAKVIEILRLERRLNYSMQNFQVQLEKIFFDFVATTKNYDQLYNWISTVNLETLERKFDQGIFMDNRDYSIYRTYDRKISVLLKQNQLATYEQALSWIKIRISVLKIIWLIERIVSKRNLAGKESNENELIEELSKVVEQLKESLGSVKCENGVEDVLSGNGLSRMGLNDDLNLCKSISRLKIFLAYSNNYEALFNQINYIQSIMKDGQSNDCLSQLANYLNNKINDLKQFNFNGNTFKQIATYLCDLNCFTDLFSTILVLITLTHKRLKQSTKNRVNLNEFNQFISKLEQSLNNLIAHLKSIDLNTNLTKKLEACEIESIVHSNEEQATIKLSKGIKHDIVQNYTNSIKETVDILSTKSKHLSALQKAKN